MLQIVIMKYVAVVLCALALNQVWSMPVADQAGEPLPVVPLDTTHVLRRETAEPAATVTEHKENETPEAHAAHQEATLRHVDEEKVEVAKAEPEKKPEEVAKPVEAVKAELPVVKEEIKSEPQPAVRSAPVDIPEVPVVPESPVEAVAAVEAKVSFLMIAMISYELHTVDKPTPEVLWSES